MSISNEDELYTIISQARQADIIADVMAERFKQDKKWGEQNHDPVTFLAILVEEVGELAEAALHLKFGGPKAANVREEAVQTAAVAIAILECLDRDTWKVPSSE